MAEVLCWPEFKLAATAGNQVEHKGDHRENHEQMDQKTRALEHHKAADPKNKQNNGENQKHAYLLSYPSLRVAAHCYA